MRHKNKVFSMTKQEQQQQLIDDNNEILRLHKIISPSGGDMNSIFTLYQKYVDSSARGYNTSGCQSCGNSIVVYWRGLMAWYNVNKGMFN